MDLSRYIFLKPKTTSLYPKETPLRSSEQNDNQEIINNLNGTTDMMMNSSEVWKSEVITTQTRLEKTLEEIINNLNGTTDMMMNSSEVWKSEVITTQTRLEKTLGNLQSRVKVLGMSIEIYLKSYL